MSTTTFQFDRQTDALIESLMRRHGAASKGDLIRVALDSLRAQRVDRASSDGNDVGPPPPQTPLSFAEVGQHAGPIRDMDTIIELQKKFVRWILVVFSILNVGVLGLVFFLSIRDHGLLVEASRLVNQGTTTLQMMRDVPVVVTEAVLATLVGATAVQLGTVVFSMSKFLFPEVSKSLGD